MDERPTHLDLFSGIGGFSIAFEAASFRTVGFCEVDPVAGAILKKNWPHVPNFGDVRTITESLQGRVDVITGGFPCQPFSVAGKRRGSIDNRYLWPSMLEVIKHFRPSWFCGENVPGILSMGLENMLLGLEKASYRSAIFNVPACGVGAQHERERIWILSNRHEIRRDDSGTRAYNLERKEAAFCFAPGNQWERDASSLCEAFGAKHRRTKPALCRMADGLPGKLDRVRIAALGNAIVPQVAEIFAKAIYQEIQKGSR